MARVGWAIAPPCIYSTVSKMPRISKKLIQSILETVHIQKTSHITHHHIAIILSARGKVLAISDNRAGSRSQGCGHSDYTIHAERAVIKKLGDKTLLKGATLIVIRQNSAKTAFIKSDPCHDCKLQLLKHMIEDGLKWVYHS